MNTSANSKRKRATAWGFAWLSACTQARACLVEHQHLRLRQLDHWPHGQGLAWLNRWPGPGRCLVNTSASSKRKPGHSLGLCLVERLHPGQGAAW